MTAALSGSPAAAEAGAARPGSSGSPPARAAAPPASAPASTARRVGCVGPVPDGSAVVVEVEATSGLLLVVVLV